MYLFLRYTVPMFSWHVHVYLLNIFIKYLPIKVYIHIISTLLVLSFVSHGAINSDGVIVNCSWLSIIIYNICMALFLGGISRKKCQRKLHSACDRTINQSQTRNTRYSWSTSPLTVKPYLQSQQEALIHKFKNLRLGTKSIYVYSS